jgi:hypothetical protein
MSSKEDMKFSDFSGVSLAANNAAMDDFNPCGVFKIVCHASDGSIRWEEESPNLVVNAGKNDLLNQYFRGSSYTGSFFVGLRNNGAISSGDTMSAKTWTEITAYSNATRPAYTTVLPTTQTITNSASPAVFNINGTAAVGGCFITTNSTKGGTTGTLFSAVDFAAVRNVSNTDTLTVTYNVTC